MAVIPEVLNLESILFKKLHTNGFAGMTTFRKSVNVRFRVSINQKNRPLRHLAKCYYFRLNAANPE